MTDRYAKYVSPHEQMTRLDNEGKAYWITDLVVVGRPAPKDTADRPGWDVLRHSADWLVLCPLNSGNPATTLNMAHVISLHIEAGGEDFV